MKSHVIIKGRWSASTGILPNSSSPAVRGEAYTTFLAIIDSMNLTDIVRNNEMFDSFIVYTFQDEIKSLKKDINMSQIIRTSGKWLRNSFYSKPSQ
jgi:hypothetical protein